MDLAVVGPELERTCEDPLLTARDHCLLLRAVQQHAPALLASLGDRARHRRLPVRTALRAVADLESLDARVRFIAEQVLGFFGPLSEVPLPSSYAGALESLDRALAGAPHPLAVLHAVAAHQPGTAALSCGLEVALEHLSEGLELSSGVTSGSAVFGRARPADVARACARGCAWGAMAGALQGAGSRVGAAAGGMAWAAQAALWAASLALAD
jgi:hypothetical protein